MVRDAKIDSAILLASPVLLESCYRKRIIVYLLLHKDNRYHLFFFLNYPYMKGFTISLYPTAVDTSGLFEWDEKVPSFVPAYFSFGLLPPD